MSATKHLNRTTALCACEAHETCPGQVMVAFPEASSAPYVPCECVCHVNVIRLLRRLEAAEKVVTMLRARAPGIMDRRSWSEADELSLVYAIEAHSEAVKNWNPKYDGVVGPWALTGSPKRCGCSST